MTVDAFIGADRRWLRLWKAAAPARWVIAHFPTRKGRGRLTWILDRILDDPRRGPSTVVLALPTGGRVLVQGGTSIVRAAIAQGQFEAAELAMLSDLCTPGSVAIDVGANVGLFTVAFARAVGPSGRVVAIEPYDRSVIELTENVRRNDLENVVILPIAVGATSGTGRIIMSDDPALIRVEPGTDDGAEGVAVSTLDEVWEDLGRPTVSVLKIDVELSELSVLRGATALLSTGPIVMVESHEAEYEQTAALLTSRGYLRQPAHLEPWNHVFRYGMAPTEASVADRSG
jgi:FkbM family methyltransferase